MNIPRTLRTVLFFFFAVAVCGCASVVKKRVAPARSSDEVSGRILNPATLNQGGKVLIVPFTAGEGVAATDETERIALRLVRGMSVALEGQGKLVVLSGEKAQDADFVIKGRIVRSKEKKGMPKFFRARATTRYLALQGEVVARKNGEVLAYFSDEEKSRGSADDWDALAERMGTRISEFLLKGIQ